MCDWLVPDHDAISEGASECLFPDGHEGEHLSRLRDGSYLLWEPEEGCGCEEARRGDYCGCFVYNFISAGEAEKLIKKAVS